MSVSVRFEAAAARELHEAVRYYEVQAPGLGAEMLDEVEAAVALIGRHPDIGTPYEVGSRRKLLPRFPYSIVYLADDQGILIVALVHHRQRPGYWAGRLT